MTHTVDHAAPDTGNAKIPTTPAAGSRRRWWVLFVVALTQLVVVLDGTIVNIALPAAQLDLGLSDMERQWVVTAYALVFGALLLLGGRIADVWGRKRSFMLGMLGFGAASLYGGLAQTGIDLIVARGLQNLALVGVDPADAGAASATVNVAMQFGGSLGLSVFALAAAGASSAATKAGSTPSEVMAAGYGAVFLTACIALVAAAVAAFVCIRGKKMSSFRAASELLPLGSA